MVQRPARRSEVRVSPIRWQGSPRVDVRLFIWAEELERMIPTRRGLSLRLDQIDQFIEEIRDAAYSFGECD